MNCARCGKPLPPPPWYRNDDCPHCTASLHACVQCANYSSGHHNDCLESQADRVVDKERANFCDWFKPADGKPATGESKAAALSALEALFRK